MGEQVKTKRSSGLFDIRNIVATQALFMASSLLAGAITGVPFWHSVFFGVGFTVFHFFALFIIGGRTRLGCFFLSLTAIIVSAIFWWMVGGGA